MIKKIKKRDRKKAMNDVATSSRAAEESRIATTAKLWKVGPSKENP